MLTPSDDFLRRLPKAELHVHLDGSLRPATLAELARERGAPLPVYDEMALRTHMLVSDASNLEEYLDRFALTLSVMQDAEALERISYELALDHAEENVRYVEVRFCPALCTRDGLTSEEVLDAALSGLRQAEEETGIRTGVIVCALRTLDPTVSMEMAEAAVAYKDRGVCAFDLAGAEAGFPVEDHVAAFDYAREHGLCITVHAGEGYGPASIEQAVELARTNRIGHGTRLEEAPDLLECVRDRGIALEICMTSNVQTRVAADYESHPLRRYFEQGLRVSLCTDNRLMSGVTLTDEYRHARDAQGFTREELIRVARMGFESAFTDEAARADLLTRFDVEVAGLE